MSPRAAPFTPHALLLLMIAIWGVSYVVVKDTLALLSPFAIVAIRFWLAVVCLLPLALRGDAMANLRAAARPGLLTGVALAIGYLLQTVGMRETTASMGGFLAGLIPLLVAVGGFLLFGASLGRRGLLGLALGFAGMGCLVWPTPVPAGAVADSPLGIALQVGSAISYAAHILLLSRFGRTTPPTAFCLWQLGCTALIATVALALQGQLGANEAAMPPLTLRLALDLAYLGVLATAIGIAVQARVQPRIAPMHVALLFATQPLFAALAGWAALGDAMGKAQLLGGVLIVLGIVVTSSDARVKPPGRVD